MTKMILLFEPCNIILLELSPLTLITVCVGMVAVTRQVELIGWLITREVLVDDDDPGLFLLLVGVEKFELRVGDAAIFWIYLGRLGAITVANKLYEALTRIELFSQPLTQFAIAGGKIILRNRIDPERADRPRYDLTGGTQFFTHGREKQTRSVHGSLLECPSHLIHCIPWAQGSSFSISSSITATPKYLGAGFPRTWQSARAAPAWQPLFRPAVTHRYTRWNPIVAHA